MLSVAYFIPGLLGCLGPQLTSFCRLRRGCGSPVTQKAELRANSQRLLFCYTSPFPPMFKTMLRYCVCPLLFLLLSRCMAQQETTSLWQSSASEFVQAILSRAGSPSAITVSFENVSTLASADYDGLRKLLLANFRNSGVRLVKADFSQAEV